MVLILHAHPKSTCSNRVMVTLEELGVEYQLREVQLMAGEQKTPEHLAKYQPFGKIPILEDDGYFVYESRAIAKYLARKYEGKGTKLILANDDLKQYGLLEQAYSVEENYFNPAAEGLAVEHVFKGMKGLGGPDAAKVASLAKDLENTLAVYEGILSKQKYIAGNELSLADLFHLPYGSMGKKIGYAEVFAKFPKVDAWIKGLEARESWKKVSA